MLGKKTAALAISLVVVIGWVPAISQEQSPAQTDKDKVIRVQKAVVLLDQLIGEASLLKLPENRIHIQVTAGDLLWTRDEPRARALFAEAAGNLADLMRRSDPVDRRSNTRRPALELRQSLVMTVARHNAELAYQMLQTLPAPPTSGPGDSRPDGQRDLEQTLVAMIAANDPKMALKNAQEWLDKGEYPSSLTRVLSQLHLKDAESAKKLSDNLIKRLTSEELLAKQDAARLAVSLVRFGPRPEKNTAGSAPAPINSNQALAESAFRELLGAAITAALRATPQAAGTARGPGDLRGGPNRGAPQNAPRSQADVAQANARILLSGLLMMQQQVDQYLPERSLALRQKLTQMGMEDDSRAAIGQLSALLQQGTSDSLIAAAATAPAGMQSRVYQQAAMKAVDEGKPDRAREIASTHLDGTVRENALRAIELRQATRSASANKMDDVRRAIAGARSDDERVSLHLQFAHTLQAENPKAALQLIEEARAIVTSRRAANYGQLEAQLTVARAFASLDPSRSFDTLEPGINVINELLSAAAVLNGFEVHLFREGELPLQGGGALMSIVSRFGRELASLAQFDFERAQMMTERFQLAEPRILAKLSMVRGLLGVNTIEPGNRGFGFNNGGGFVRRPE